VPEPVMLDGLTLAVSPLEGVTERSTVPVKPLKALTVMVAVLDVPASRGLMIVGLAVTLKSGP